MRGKSHAVALAVAATALFGFANPTGLLADESVEAGPNDVAPAGTPVLVVNNHLYTVTVYAFDADGERHKLGRLVRVRGRRRSTSPRA